jgi:hypothetical protein
MISVFQGKKNATQTGSKLPSDVLSIYWSWSLTLLACLLYHVHIFSNLKHVIIINILNSQLLRNKNKQKLKREGHSSYWKYSDKTSHFCPTEASQCFTMFNFVCFIKLPYEVGKADVTMSRMRKRRL